MVDTIERRRMLVCIMTGSSVKEMKFNLVCFCDDRPLFFFGALEMVILEHDTCPFKMSAPFPIFYLLDKL